MSKSSANDSKAATSKSREESSFVHSEQSESAKTKSNLLQIPSITLPKGGGAIKSIDEKFLVNAMNGTASFTVPVPLSPGRNGGTPALALGYNSGSGNSAFGLGWSLDVHCIHRRTEKRLPEYKDGDHSDVFVLSGVDDLVPEPGQDPLSKVVRYRPRIEGLFARIEKINDNGKIYWKMRSKENVVSVFGESDEARLSSPVSGEENKIFKWCLQYSYDDHGNFIRYEYKKENTEKVLPSLSEKNRLNGIAPFTNLYLKRVLYGNTTAYYEEDGASFPDQFYFEMVIDYGEHNPEKPTTKEESPWTLREDPFSDYRPGFELRYYRLCRRILMFHHFREELGWDDYLVHSLDFTYDEHPHLSYLELITQTGYIWQPDGSLASKRSFPPLQFGYFKPGFSREVKEISVDSSVNAPIGLDNERYHFTDLYSEGVSGILTEQATGWYYKENLGEGSFTPARLVSPRPASTGLNNAFTIQELEGNYKKYLVKTGGGMKGFFELTDSDEWQTFSPFEKVPNIDFKDPNLKFLDLSGDGMPDLLISRDQDFIWYAAKGKVGYDDYRVALKATSEEKGPKVLFANEDEHLVVATADMTGDGLSDIVVISSSSCAYYPNLGFGRFGARVTMEMKGCFDTPTEFNPHLLHLSDIDGSGTTDLIYTSGAKVQVWYNQSGNSLKDPGEFFNPFPQVDSQSKISFVDLLGNGTNCMVCSSPLPASVTAPLKYIDLTGGKKPHLMDKYVNNLGKEVSLEYTPSTRFYLSDKLEGKKWITKLPFVVQCVSKVVREDKVASTLFTTEYSYHHGYYDAAEREFRGFALVVQKEKEQYSETLFQPTSITKSWFHTGAFLKDLQQDYYPGANLAEVPFPEGLSADELPQCARALKGLPLRQEIYGEEDTIHPYSTVQHSYEVLLLQPKGEQLYAVFLSSEKQTLTVNYERNPVNPRIAHTINVEIDGYGHILESASIVYGRKNADPSLPTDRDREKQTRQQVVYTLHGFTKLIDLAGGAYRLPSPCESRTYELNTSVPAEAFFTSDEIKARFTAATEKLYEQEAALNEKRKTEHTRILFLKNDLSGPMPPGEQDTRALSYEDYLLSFTPTLLQSIYGGKVDEALLRNKGLYVRSEGDDNYWIKSGKTSFGPDAAFAKSNFFLPVAFEDNFGNLTQTFFDTHKLFITRTVDALGNENNTDASNYRILAPWLVRDANNNRSAVRFDELGLVTATFAMGKESEFKGDLVDVSSSEASPDDHPSTILQSEFRYFSSGGVLADRVTKTVFEKHYYQEPQPSTGGFLNWLTRLFGGGGNNAPAVEADRKTQTSYFYFDGSGHEVLKKLQAEPGASGELRWVGTGRAIYSAKGRPVKQYEPWFDRTAEYNSEEELAPLAFCTTTYYDALGRVIKTAKPNGTYSSVTYAAWQRVNYDENDTAGSDAPSVDLPNTDWYTSRISGARGVAEQETAQKAAIHYNTPETTYLDSLGRPFLVRAHNITKRSSEVAVEEFYFTCTELDIEGNARSVSDARGNTVMSWKYDMLGNICFQRSMDAGDRWMLADVMARPLRLWDSRGQVFSFEYDALHRPLAKSVNAGGGEINFEKFEYGEGTTDDLKYNLRAKLFKHYDTAGVVINEAYDFKSNLLVATRQLLQDYKSLPDWKTAPALEADEYTTETAFDALNRPVKTITPDDSVFIPGYNEANLLETLEVNIKGETAATRFIQNINYNAKGQRLEVFYGNNTRTAYSYEPETFRLVQLLTTADAGNRILQDLNYNYDPVGNITRQFDNAQKTVFYSGQIVEAENAYYYDALYRLIEASGREHTGQTTFSAQDNWSDEWCRLSVQPNSAVQLRNYTQKYVYDGAGNILKMQHIAGATASWTRNCTYNAANNQLIKSAAGGQNFSYTYNAHGSLLSMPHLPLIDWNFRDELQHANLGGGGEAYFVYDSGGQRVRKVIERAGGKKEERIYLGPFEIYRERTGGTVALERETLHVMGGQERLAMIDSRTKGNDGTDKRLIRYQYGDHLGSACLELDGDAKIISYEEYHPYGTTSCQATDASRQVAKKRYRYTGMERDEETGLSYHHARYYLPWLGSWMSADPSSIAGGLNLYAYARNNPVIHIDRNGMQSIPGPHDAGTPPPPPPPPPAHTGSGAGSGATAGATGGTAHPPAPTTPTRDITRIEVHYANSSGTGAVTITAHTASGGTITMRGMGGGARDKRGRVHTTSTRHGTVEPGGSQRDANHTSSLYPSRTPNMRFYVPFGGGEGFHMGPIGAQSHGCIHLEENDARTIFNRAQTGAQVEITVPPPPPRPPRRRATPHKTSAPAATTPKKKKN